MALLALLPAPARPASLSALAPPPPAPPVVQRFRRPPAPAPGSTLAGASVEASPDRAAPSALPLLAAAAVRPAVRHVIIVSEDGLRPDALAQARPPVHDALMRGGAWSLAALTIRHASTLPAHAAMLSGFDVAAHGLDWNSWRPERGFIRVPTLFDAADHAGGGAAAFVGKWKLQHITPPGSVEVFARPGYLCPKVVAEAARYFVEHRPAVEFVHFSDPDEAGHSIGWMSDRQIDSVRASDRCLGHLVQAVADAGMAGDTLFILSADHGGHGRNHSGAVDVDRRIPWIAWGAGVREGYQIKRQISTMDTAATALWVLGYPPPPGLQGKPVTEAFR